ncbi:slipin family protein [Calderihabitans maritimus]|nr:slipin family protein [Calderihabitans maritimus]
MIPPKPLDNTDAGKKSLPETPVKFGIVISLFLMGMTGLVLGIWQVNIFLIAISIALTALSLASIRIAHQWQKAVILRLGRYYRTAGPGPFLIIPLVDTVAAWIDQRIMITTFTAEQALTKDTVPVDVDAVLFWVVWDPEKAAMEVADYKTAVSWAAQTALREVIGRTPLSELLAAREHLDEELQKIIDARTEPWGVAVQAVEIRDIIIPAELQEAMSREAQAERERRARIILGTAETEIAHKFAEAARAYEGNEIALQLRAMNILYEGLKEKGALVIVPSSAVETMGLGTMSGLTALKHFAEEQKVKEEPGKAREGG